jgi:glutamine amidotransferase
MIAIVDTGGANHASIQNALARLGYESRVTFRRDELAAATHLILPGVGHAAHAMARLREAELCEFLRAQRKPTLGICLGMQILFASSAEGDVGCLGILPGRVEGLTASPDFRVPHMGWARLKRTSRDSRLLHGLDSSAYFYFVHSYRAPAGEATVAEAQAARPIPAVVECEHIFATQFHPERSGEAGAALLRNFVSLKENV